MKPTVCDLQFWQHKTRPSWAPKNKNDVGSGTVLHYAINSHVSKKIRDRIEPSNACNILKMVRKRGEILSIYMLQAQKEYHKVQPERAVTYRRWLRRMLHAQGKLS